MDCATSRKAAKASKGVTGTTMAVFIHGLYESGAIPGSTPGVGGTRHSDENTLFFAGLP